MIKNCEFRNDGNASININSRTIEGHAAIFNKWSNPIPGTLNGKQVVFREMIIPGAFAGLIDTQDVTANFNHEDERGILARSKKGKGSLFLMVDEFGLKYSFEAPDTTLGRDIMEGLKRGDIDSSSFAFIVAQGGEKWGKNADGMLTRTISKFGKLIDVSLVVRPAYDEAKVSLRILQPAGSETRDLDLEAYYERLRLEYI